MNCIEIKQKKHIKSHSLFIEVSYLVVVSSCLTLSSHVLAKRIIQMIYRIDVHEYIIILYHILHTLLCFFFIWFTHKKSKEKIETR